MLHRRLFRVAFTISLAVGLAAAVSYATSMAPWSAGPSPLVKSQPLGLPELGDAPAPFVGPVAVRPWADLRIGGGSATPLLEGLPPVFASFANDRRNSAASAGARNNGPFWGDASARQSRGSSASAGPRGLSFVGGGSGVGWPGSSAEATTSAATAPRQQRPPAARANRGGGSPAAAGSGGSDGLFAEQATSIAALTESPVELGAAALDATAAGAFAGSSVGGMASTPEPGSLLLIGTGVLGMIGALRRRMA